MSIEFEWDRDKAQTNAKKHGVTFDEASSVFADPLAVIFTDEAHSIDESREIMIGHSAGGRLMVVSFRERRDAIRIISARFDSKHEREDYEQRPLG